MLYDTFIILWLRHWPQVEDWGLEYGGQVRQRPEGGGNVMLFPKDMLNPVGTTRNDRTGQFVGPWN